MTQRGGPAKGSEGVGEMWELLREHHGDLAGLKRDVGSLGRDVGFLSETVNKFGAKLDDIKSTVTQHTSRQAPTLVELMGGMALLLSIVGGLAVGIGTFVSATYDARLAASDARVLAVEKEVGELNGVVSTWRMEALDELARLRTEQKAVQDSRLKALEAQAGWTPTTSPP